jgi:hypothetical protein
MSRITARWLVMGLGFSAWLFGHLTPPAQVRQFQLLFTFSHGWMYQNWNLGLQHIVPVFYHSTTNPTFFNVARPIKAAAGSDQLTVVHTPVMTP